MGLDRHIGIAIAVALLVCVRALPAQSSPAPSSPASSSPAPSSNAPSFTAGSIVLGATQLPGALAPNSIATIYGTNLSWTTQPVTTADLNGGTLPTSLAGVSVYVNGILSNLLYVSPGQINFLVPYEINAASAQVLVARQGIAGPLASDGLPSVSISMAHTAPGFFVWNGNFAVAQHADGTLICPTSPSEASEVVVLYAGGLGRTVPDTTSGAAPQTAMSIYYFPQMQILLDDVPIPQTDIYYAGVTPGFAGLYQINIRLPAVLPPDPRIQIVIGAAASPPAVQLYTM